MRIISRKALREFWQQASYADAEQPIAGNKYRLVVRVNYPYRIIYVRFVGTHRQYDQIDAERV